MKIPIERIQVQDRIREDMGSMTGLEESIQEFGLLNPILVNSQYQLLAGARRLSACKKLGWQEVEVHIIDITSSQSMLEIESHENSLRKDFTHLELEKLIRKKQQFLRKGWWKKLLKWVQNLFLRLFSKKKTKVPSHFRIFGA